MDEGEQLKQAVQFFKSEQAYDKLFALFRKKYESLGRIGGTVSTVSFHDEELRKISTFFGVPAGELQQKGSLALRKFEEQLAFTKFDSIHLHQLLEGYFKEPIFSKKEQQARRESQVDVMLDDLRKTFPSLDFWINGLQEKKSDTRWIIQMMEKSPVAFKELVGIVEMAFTNLPKEAERLPMFSQRITGDPHAFDLHTNVSRLFLHLLTVHQAGMIQHIPVATSTTEEINKLLGDYHIYRDDLLNFVTCANLIAETEQGIHPVWQAAAQTQTVQIIPLRELLELVTVIPANKHGKVFIVENSGVCATLLDKIPSAPIVCTNGQFTLASWTLLEKLVAAGNILYYAGDLDPEGLQIADRLKERFGTAIRLWHMDIAAYEKSVSAKELSQERLEKLRSINNEQLVGVAKEMKHTRKAGYQEALVEWMIKDLI